MAKKNNDARIPPQNLEAECAVLGAVLMSDEALNDVLEVLTPGDFYDRRNALIFGAIHALFESRQNVDIVTISDQLKRMNAVDDAGGSAYLTELVEAVPTSANAVYYANIVKDHSSRRRLIDACTLVVTKGFDGENDTKDLFDLAERKIFEISSEKEKQQAVHIKGSMHEVINTIAELREKGGHLTGVPSGFLDLDKITSGFQPSNVIVVGARPSVGKTAFALAMAEYAAVEKKIPVVFFSLEMSRQEVGQRLVANQSGVSMGAIRNGYVSASDFPRLTNAAAKLSSSPFFIDDTAGLNPMELRSKARRLKSKENIGLIIIDYLQLMNYPGKSESRQQEISSISRSIKMLARELHVPIIALSQLSRKADDSTDRKDNTRRPPELSHLRESGAIEQDADLVILLHRPEMDGVSIENMGGMQVLIRKHRNGPIGDVQLRFRRELMRFENMTQQGE